MPIVNLGGTGKPSGNIDLGGYRPPIPGGYGDGSGPGTGGGGAYLPVDPDPDPDPVPVTVPDPGPQVIPWSWWPRSGLYLWAVEG